MKYIFEYMIYLIAGWFVAIIICECVRMFLLPKSKYDGDIKEFQDHMSTACLGLVFVIIIFAMVVSLITFGVGVLSG